jgi:hypothetical protein
MWFHGDTFNVVQQEQISCEYQDHSSTRTLKRVNLELEQASLLSAASALATIVERHKLVWSLRRTHECGYAGVSGLPGTPYFRRLIINPPSREKMTRVANFFASTPR